ncbi:LOG family protein [Paucilactobacillus sp. N302-9]
MKKIAVYCGASVGNDEIYSDSAAQLGEWLVEKDYELVYGGGKFGLMGIVARAVIDNGGIVWGFIPEELKNRGLAFNQSTHLKIVENMSIRKKAMLDLSDACIALPGGPGTLEEIGEAFSWAVIGDNASPCVFYNINGYYDPLQHMFDQMVEHGFMEASARQKILFSDSLTEIDDFMTNYTPPALRTYDK